MITEKELEKQGWEKEGCSSCGEHTKLFSHEGINDDSVCLSCADGYESMRED